MQKKYNIVVNNIKVAFLFIGAIVGAGFATGREVVLFFGGKSIATIVFAGLLIGMSCGVFLYFGKVSFSSKIYTRLNSFSETIIVLCTITTFSAMCCGAETLLYEACGIKNLGLFCGILASLLCLFNIESLKKLNSYLVVLIIIFVFYLSSKVSATTISGDFSLSKAVSYTALNMMLGGFLIKTEGAKMTGKNILIVAIIVAVAFTAMLVSVMRISSNYLLGSMPVFDFARSARLEFMATLIIFLSIFSTMLGSGKIVAEPFYTFKKSQLSQKKGKGIAFVFLALLSILSFKLPFKTVVDTTYPIVSIIGILYLLFVVMASLIYAIKSTKFSRQNHIHSQKIKFKKRLSTVKLNTKVSEKKVSDFNSYNNKGNA